MAGQLAIQKIQMDSKAKMQVQDAEIQGQMRKLQMEAQLKAGLMDKEFQMNIQLRTMEMDNIAEREETKETAKSDRISQQNTEQSKMINQRKNNLPPMSFESNEDSLDGFDLAEFSPR